MRRRSYDDINRYCHASQLLPLLSCIIAVTYGSDYQLASLRPKAPVGRGRNRSRQVKFTVRMSFVQIIPMR